MVAANTKYARLNKDQIGKLQDLEKEIGKVIVAFEPSVSYANLTEEQLKKVQQVENELGLVLVAFKK